jgi:hypothetical protein
LRLFSEDGGGLRYRPRADTEDHHMAETPVVAAIKSAPPPGTAVHPPMGPRELLMLKHIQMVTQSLRI